MQGEAGAGIVVRVRGISREEGAGGLLLGGAKKKSEIHVIFS